MKTRRVFLFGMLAVMLAFGLSLAGCATASSIGGTADTHGLFSQAKAVSDGDAIASYSVILGLLDSGYDEYVATVRQAAAGGKKITTVTTQYFGFFTKVTAYAK